MSQFGFSIRPEPNSKMLQKLLLDTKTIPEAVKQIAAVCGTDVATYSRPGMSAFALEDGVVYHGCARRHPRGRSRRRAVREGQLDVACKLSVAAPKKSENADIELSALGEKIMKITTLILALLALALGTGTAIVVSVQTQPVVACGSPNC
jgi:hypothetical protein